MGKLKIVSKAMMILGLVSLISGIILSLKEIMEFGLGIGVAGIVAYAATYIVGSTEVVEHKSNSD